MNRGGSQGIQISEGPLIPFGQNKYHPHLLWVHEINSI